ncbi:MAG: penicillin-binding protein [Lactobacillales bacterium]|nr:penicillin-binding protein [Lactobacillales bacterium]
MWKKLIFKINENSLGPVKNRKYVGKILFYITLIFFIICVYRVGRIVITGKVSEVSLEQKTKELYEGTKVVQAKRGVIYDRNGNSIAENAYFYSVKAILSTTFTSGNKKLYVQEKDFYPIAEILQKYLAIDSKEAMKTMKEGVERELYQVEFGTKGREISLNTRQAIQEEMKKQHLEGLQFDEQPGRSYPNGDFASHLIGFIKRKEEGIEGAFGLEAAYEDILCGKSGRVAYEKDSDGNPMPGTEAIKKRAINGKDIYTTLDIHLQNYLETLMSELQKEQGPENMTATLMDAKTGEILAMSQRPSFNPETKKGLTDEKMDWKNIPIQDSFEPGSTMKAVMAAIAENEGKFSPDAPYIAGVREIYDRQVGDWDYNDRRVGFHTLTFLQGLAASSNVGMTYLKDFVGGDALHLYQQRFGFGQFLGNGIGGDSYGDLPKVNSPVDMTMSSFGQAITVTGMQMMRAYSAIANNGRMLEPHFISKIVNSSENLEKKVEPEVMGCPIREQAARNVRKYLEQVVKDPVHGVGYNQATQKGFFDVPGVDLSVKTGTAEIAKTDGTGFIKGNYLYSAAVIAPSEDPEFILYVTCKLPKKYHAGMIPEITNPLLKRAFSKQTQVSDEFSRVNEEITIANYKGKSPRDAENNARHDVLQVTVVGDGTKVIDQSIKAKTKTSPNTRIIIRANGEMQMPDVTGWKKSDMEQLARIMNIKVKYSGKGELVISQSVASYLGIQEGTQVDIGLG